MPDNLEQLEKDWPQRHPKNLSPQAFTWMYFAGAIVTAAFVNLEVDLRVYRWHASHPGDPLWLLTAIATFFALQSPWLFALGAHRQIRKISASVSSEVMQQIRQQGTFLIFWIYSAFLILLNSMDLMRR